MAQVNSSRTAYSTEANHFIYSMCCHTVSEQFTAHSYKYWFYLLFIWYFCLVTPHMNKITTCQHHVFCRTINTHTECTMNAAVVVYTHLSYVVLDGSLHIEEGASITLIMCTTNNCLVERASTSLESRLEKRLPLVDRSDNYYLPSQHTHIIDTVKSIAYIKIHTCTNTHTPTSMETTFQHVVECHSHL